MTAVVTSRPSSCNNHPAPRRRSKHNRRLLSNISIPTIPHTAISPSPSDLDRKSQLSLDSAVLVPSITLDSSNSSIPITSLDQFMPDSLDRQSSQSSYHYSLPDSSGRVSSWTHDGGGSGRPGVANSVRPISRGGAQNRAQSSCIVSATPFQQQQATRLRPGEHPRKVANGPSHPQDSPSSHLPTPTHTPTRVTFPQTPSNSNFSPAHSSTSQRPNLNSAAAASQTMNQSMLDPHRNVEGVSHMSQNDRSPLSNIVQEPVTPMTVVSDYHDDSARPQVDTMSTSMIPKLERTVTDAYNDGIFYTDNMQMSQSSNTPYIMSKGNQMVQERLNDARMARSASGSSNQSVPVSPFKAHSQLLSTPVYSGSQHMPQLQVPDRDTQDLQYEVSPRTDSAAKTISPQEAMLDYTSSGNEVPLFGEPAANFDAYTAVSPNPVTTTFQQTPTMAFNDASSWTTADLQQATLSSAPLQSYTAFPPSTMPHSASMRLPSHGFVGGQAKPIGQYRQTEVNPEFRPPPLLSMESSVSEAAPPSSAASTLATSSPKPQTAADTGTYSCTYHGCTRRFSTPQNLQRHKRDVHRSNPHVTPGIGSGMSAADLMERNSQSGPHKCIRINPTTGKACNAIFSRPYDLTRHEDTIHNVRKQKVKCALCVEEKTFSRSDALTRHMRVVHPEVDFPGKHLRRRGGRGD